MEELKKHLEEYKAELIIASKKLIASTTKILKKRVPYKNDDEFALMTLRFFCQQIEMLDSIIILIERNKTDPAIILSRSCIEGMYLLLWAELEPKERGARWLHYLILEEYWSVPEEISDSHKEEYITLQKLFDKYRDKYLTIDARANNYSGYEQKNFHKNWYEGKSITDIIKAVNDSLWNEQHEKDNGDTKEQFLEAWRKSSKFIHWSPYALAHSIDRTDSQTTFNPNLHSEEGTIALENGYKCLSITLGIMAGHLGVKIDDEVDDQFRRLLEIRKGILGR